MLQYKPSHWAALLRPSLKDAAGREAEAPDDGDESVATESSATTPESGSERAPAPARASDPWAAHYATHSSHIRQSAPDRLADRLASAAADDEETGPEPMSLGGPGSLEFEEAFARDRAALEAIYEGTAVEAEEAFEEPDGEDAAPEGAWWRRVDRADYREPAAKESDDADAVEDAVYEAEAAFEVEDDRDAAEGADDDAPGEERGPGRLAALATLAGRTGEWTRATAAPALLAVGTVALGVLTWLAIALAERIVAMDRRRLALASGALAGLALLIVVVTATLRPNGASTAAVDPAAEIRVDASAVTLAVAPPDEVAAPPAAREPNGRARTAALDRKPVQDRLPAETAVDTVTQPPADGRVTHVPPTPAAAAPAASPAAVASPVATAHPSQPDIPSQPAAPSQPAPAAPLPAATDQTAPRAGAATPAEAAEPQAPNGARSVRTLVVLPDGTVLRPPAEPRPPSVAALSAPVEARVEPAAAPRAVAPPPPLPRARAVEPPAVAVPLPRRKPAPPAVRAATPAPAPVATRPAARRAAANRDTDWESAVFDR